MNDFLEILLTYRHVYWWCSIIEPDIMCVWIVCIVYNWQEEWWGSGKEIWEWECGLEIWGNGGTRTPHALTISSHFHFLPRTVKLAFQLLQGSASQRSTKEKPTHISTFTSDHPPPDPPISLGSLAKTSMQPHMPLAPTLQYRGGADVSFTSPPPTLVEGGNRQQMIAVREKMPTAAEDPSALLVPSLSLSISEIVHVRLPVSQLHVVH